MFTTTTEPRIYEGITVEEMRDLLSEEGYRAKLDQAGDKPVLRSSTGGTKFSVRFYGLSSTSNKATSITFVAYFTTDMKGTRALDAVNKWNDSKRFARAIIDSDGDLVVDADVLLGKGITRAQMLATLEFWCSLLDTFRTTDL